MIGFRGNSFRICQGLGPLGRARKSAGHSGMRIGEGIGVFCVAPVGTSEILFDNDVE
jgi:hypothetical protein